MVTPAASTVVVPNFCVFMVKVTVHEPFDAAVVVPLLIVVPKFIPIYSVAPNPLPETVIKHPTVPLSGVTEIIFG